jgi:hypothetical protein
MNIATIRSTDSQFASTDGLRIACTRWDAAGPSRGIVQIAHGLGEHIGRYAGLIEILSGALDGLVELAKSASSPAEIVNAAFQQPVHPLIG